MTDRPANDMPDLTVRSLLLPARLLDAADNLERMRKDDVSAILREAAEYIERTNRIITKTAQP